MRTITKGEFQNLRQQFADGAGNLALFSVVLQYGYNDRNNNLVNSSTWEEDGFYGMWTIGGVEQNEEGKIARVSDSGISYITTTDINATIKIPSHFYKDGFELLNPARPSAVDGARGHFRFDEAATVNYNGRIRLVGVVLKALYGDRPRVLADAQYALLGQPVETIDGASLLLEAKVMPTYYTFVDYVKMGSDFATYPLGFLPYIPGLPSGYFIRHPEAI